MLTDELRNTRGDIIIKDTSAGIWYAENVSGDISRITVNNIPGTMRYAVNVTFINPFTNKAYQRANRIFLVDFLQYFHETAGLHDRNAVGPVNPWNKRIIADFMRGFIHKNVFCTNHGGKMKYINSCSTSAGCNARCKARAAAGDNDCICTHCFANAQMEYQKSTRQKYARNTELLTSVHISPEWVPAETDNDIFRLESFGDINNELQVYNYFSIAKARPLVNHTLWTKNPDIIASAIKRGPAVPENLNIIYSSPYLNTPRPDMLKKYPFIHQIFTVWTSEQAAARAGVSINCGARACNTCRRCYEPTKLESHINELLK